MEYKKIIDESNSQVKVMKLMFESLKAQLIALYLLKLIKN